MSSMLKTVEKEIIRLEIMELCQMAAPEGTNVKIIRGCLKKNEEELPEEEIFRQVDYLKGKGLLSVVKVNNSRLGISREVIKITPAVVDYIEGNAGDIAGIGE